MPQLMAVVLCSDEMGAITERFWTSSIFVSVPKRTNSIAAAADWTHSVRLETSRHLVISGICFSVDHICTTW